MSGMFLDEIRPLIVLAVTSPLDKIFKTCIIRACVVLLSRVSSSPHRRRTRPGQRPKKGLLQQKTLPGKLFSRGTV